MNMIFASLSVLLMTSNIFTPEPMDELRYRRTGGYILQRGSFAGKIVVANAVGPTVSSEVYDVVKLLKEVFGVNISAIDTTEKATEKILKGSEATAVLVILEDDFSPNLLIAPDEHWATVNSKRIAVGLMSESARKKFQSSRLRKAIIKAFSLLLGGGASQYPGKLMNATTLQQLDLCKEQIPVDVIDRIQKYFAEVGITQASYTTYRRACREGWAPAPTNDVQKAIWEKVHAIPKNPLKIEFDPKKGR